MSRFKFVWRLMPLIGMLTLLLTGCGDPTLSALDPKGPVAKEQLLVMQVSIGVMIFVLVVVFAIYFYVIVRYRKRKGDNSIPKQVEGNHVLEIVWTVIPILLLVVIAIPTIKYTFEHSRDYTKDKDAVHIKVIGHQFWWQFQYTDHDINTAQDLVIPVGQKVAFEINAADVAHSFWVPSLGGKIDANPGDKDNNVLYLQADEPGVYKGKCAELCGASHALMDFKVVAVSQDDYKNWINKMKAPVAPAPAEAAKGEQLFKDNCLACHAVESNGKGLGPNLNGFASREKIAGFMAQNNENLTKWIQDPQTQKPGTLMPVVKDKTTGQPLNKDQVAEIVKYLNTLKLK